MPTTNNNLVTANLAALNAAVQLQTDGATLPSVGSVAIKVTGNWVGTLAFEATVDGSNWDSVNATPLNSSGGPVITTTTANGLWGISVFGYQAVRVRASLWTSGTAVVTLDGTPSPLPIQPLAAVTVQSSSAGGPPLASGISISTGAPGSNSTAGSSPASNLQGKGFARLGINPTTSGDTTLVFLDNPWTSGLDLGNAILLSAGVLGGAKEEVIVSLNNNPAAGAAPVTVNLVSPVVFGGSNTATFDTFAVAGPNVHGATAIGIPVQSTMLVDPYAMDAKRPMKAWQQALSNPGMGGIVTQPDLMGGTDEAKIKQYLAQMLYEMRVLVFLVSQLKDGGSMEIPANWSGLPTDTQ